MSAPPPRVIRARLFLRELFDGNLLASPAAAPKYASWDRASAAIEDLSLFLREYVEQAAPSAIARLVLPEGTALREIAVALPREELPRRLAREVPITFACVVIPEPVDEDPSAPRRPAGVWVFVPALDHTFYVRGDEALDEVVRGEIRRLVAARDLSPWDRLGLFPARAHRLEPIEIPLPAADRLADAARSRKALAARARRADAIEKLDAVATPLHLDPASKRAAPLVGRDDELAMLSVLLDGKERLGVVIVGPEGAGKSALFRAFLARSNRPVYATSGAQLIAGMSGLGQWQERVREVMEAIRELDAILYFDNLEDLLAERVESGGADLPGAMRPWLDEGLVRVAGELRPESMDVLESRHYAFFAALTRLRVEPLSPAVTRSALERRVAHDAEVEPHRPGVEPAALTALVDLAERYLPYGAFPGKAIRLYQDLRAAREWSGDTAFTPIGKRDLHTLFALVTGVPELLLREDAPLRVDDVAQSLSAKIIGQERAVRALAETIGVVKAGLQPEHKPLATFLFVGPTGVGKTELARALAEYLFGAPDRMVRFDMSEYALPDAAERLIRGTDRADGLLTRAVREQPFCVLLLDEIEKAHPAVFDLLLQVAGEGRLSDVRGRIAYFQNAILIMTSNLGAADKRALVGFGGGSSSDDAHYEKAVHRAFRPEFVNRLDRIVPFRALRRDEVRAVARLAIDKLARRRGLEQAGVALKVSEAAMDRLAEEGYSEAYGARALRRHIDERVAAPLARFLSTLRDTRDLTAFVCAAGEPPPEGEGVITGRVPAGSLEITVRRKKSARSAHQVFGFDVIARLRREVDGWMTLPTVEQITDQIDFSLTQLNTGAEADDGRFRQEVSELQAEHHRLREVEASLRAPADELRMVEELAIDGLFGGEDIASLVGDAEVAHALFAEALPHALVALLPVRDEVTLILEELDEGAFEIWLAPLLELITARRWLAHLHIPGDRRAPADKWPDARIWGPPRTPAQILQALYQPKRSFRSVLLRCRGADAGAFLALEKGLHRFPLQRNTDSKGADRRGHVFVHFIALRFAVPDDMWTESKLAPPSPGTAAERRNTTPMRDRGDGAVILCGKRATVKIGKDPYWSRLDDIARAHLLLFERDEEGALSRDDWFAPPAEDADDDYERS